MNIFVINSGSSSLKYKLYNMASSQVLASGLAERIGEASGRIKHTVFPDSEQEKQQVIDAPVADHEAAMRTVIDCLSTGENRVCEDACEVVGVGHRVVHGGERFAAPARIDDEVIAGIEEALPLAPLHNPANLTGIRVARELFGSAQHVAVFDTAFHQTMPAKAYHYAVPHTLYKELKIRRYGFHGTSHQYVVRRGAQILEREQSALNCITAHLGNGSSLAAVQAGACIDTSMGMTPLAGVIMGTRSGDIDPAVLLHLVEHTGRDIGEVTGMLTKESGLVGICGASDMRDIHSRIAQGDTQARLALEMLSHSIKKYIGAFFAQLGRVDAIIFTGGIGENDDEVRRLALQDMGHMGIMLDTETNALRHGLWARISTPDSPVAVLVVRTDEEAEIASQTASVLGLEST